MTKNYSELPKSVTITNNNEYDVVLGLRNVIDAVDYILKAGDSISITVETSDALALVNQRVEELNLVLVEKETPEPEPVDIPVTKVTLSETELNMVQGDAIKLTATVEPENATDKTITWSSSSGERIYVSQTGMVSAFQVATGIIITATAASGVSAQCIVNSTEKEVEDTEETE